MTHTGRQGVRENGGAFAHVDHPSPFVIHKDQKTSSKRKFEVRNQPAKPFRRFKIPAEQKESSGTGLPEKLNLLPARPRAVNPKHQLLSH
jgi:hypothetical protein